MECKKVPFPEIKGFFFGVDFFYFFELGLKSGSGSCIYHHYYQNKKSRSISERSIIEEEERNFVTAVLMGVETVQKLKKDGKNSNVGRQNATN